MREFNKSAISKFEEYYHPSASASEGMGGYVKSNSFGHDFWIPESSPDRYDRMDRIGLFGGGSSSSPALSALGLLAFLFFLNMIQNSLVTNRLLTTRIVRNRTVNRPTQGVRPGGRILFEEEDDIVEDSEDEVKSRQIRSFILPPFEESKEFTEIPLRLPEENQPKFNESDSLAESQIQSPIQLKIPYLNSTVSTRVGRNFKTLSKPCLQLMACKLGRRLESSLGGIVFQLLRRYIVPKRTGVLGSSIVRALVNGWNLKIPCQNLYKC